MRPQINRWGLRRPSAVIDLFGAPGSGKTLLAYRIADEIRGDRPVYCPMSQRFKRPKYYRRLRWPTPDDCVVMYNDAALQFHARKWREEATISEFMLMQIRRHRNIDYIWDVQVAASADIEVIRNSDCIILKEPGLAQAEEERDSIVRRYEVAEPRMTEAGGWSKKRAYVFTHKRKEGFVLEDIEKPRYWNEDISTDDMFRKVPLYRRIF